MTVEEYEARFERSTAALHQQLSVLHGSTRGWWARRPRWLAMMIAGLAIAGLALAAGWAAYDAPAPADYVAPDASSLLGP